MTRTRIPLRRAALAAACLAAASAMPADAQTSLSRTEQRIRDEVARMRDDQVAFLWEVVNIPSCTLNLTGVKKTGDRFRAAFDSLGFRTRWVAMPDAMGRAGHLVAERTGKAGTTRMLLIGHLDTVFEGEGQGWVREDSVARGAGSSDMKGGDAILLYALKAMHRAGVLKDANVTVILTGDEESAGEPIAESRRDMLELARRSDVALAFEGGARTTAVVARRGATSWRLTVRGRQGHSSGVFGQNAGYGAIYEAARILDEFRRELSGEPNLTFNPGVIVGGERVTYDTLQLSGTAAGKTNIIAPAVTVEGDLRTLSAGQLDSARARMRTIVARSLPGTSAEIVFADGYPAMSPTPGNYRLLAVYDSASRALGHDSVTAFDPGRRGAGDISFVAPVIDGLDGLGALGNGSHSPNENVDLTTLPMQTERAAIFMYRLSRQKAQRREGAVQ